MLILAETLLDLDPDNVVAKDIQKNVFEVTNEELKKDLEYSTHLNFVIWVLTTVVAIIGLLSSIYFSIRSGRSNTQNILNTINELPQKFANNMNSGNTLHWEDPDHRIHR